MKRIILNVALVVLLFGLAPAVLFAQDDITLESLAEAVGELYERVAMIEAAIEPPKMANGVCVLYVESSPMQRDTLTKYIDKYEEEPSSMHVASVYYSEETGLTAITLDEIWPERKVVEVWKGCEYEGSTEWIEYDE